MTAFPYGVVIMSGLFCTVPVAAAAADAPRADGGVRPATAPAATAPAVAAEVFGPFRDWWYRAAAKPKFDAESTRRLAQYLEAHPEDAEAMWWASRLKWGPKRLTPRKEDELLSLAAEKRHPAAMARLGSIRMDGEPPRRPPDPQGGRKLLEEALALGEPDAALELGHAAAKGVDAPKDPEKAMAYYRQALELGTARAHFSLAGMLVNAGQDQAGFDELVRGAEAGDERCMEALSQVYRDGSLGRRGDAKRAVQWMHKASQRGYPPMQRELAKALLSGYGGVKRDDAFARKLITAAAGAKDREAMLLLARGSATGENGFAPDELQARTLFLELAKLQDPPGLYTLGRFYLDGVIKHTNATPAQVEEMALQLIRHSAKTGYAPAVHYLAEREERRPPPPTKDAPQRS